MPLFALSRRLYIQKWGITNGFVLIWSGEDMTESSNQSERRYWVVRLGSGGSYADILKEENQIAIGWEELGDLSWLIEEEDEDEGVSWDKLRENYEEEWGGSPVSVGIGSGQIWNFVLEMDKEDVVLVPTSRRTVLIGEIVGDYEFKSDWKDECHYVHRRSVKWLKEVERDDLPEHLKSSMYAHLTVYNIDKHKVAIEQMLGLETKKKHWHKVEKVSGDKLVKLVIKRVRSLPPREFEKFVSHLLGVMGFETITTPYVGDKGVDVIGVLNAEGLTNVRLKVQVRRTQGTIGIKEVQRNKGNIGS
jgi:predicted Mrr-cat superfamily restriction endonuclease